MLRTKSDKLKRSQIKKHVKIIADALNLASLDQVIPFSSMTKAGKDEVWNEIDGWLDYIKNAEE